MNFQSSVPQHTQGTRARVKIRSDQLRKVIDKAKTLGLPDDYPLRGSGYQQVSQMITSIERAVTFHAIAHEDANHPNTVQARANRDQFLQFVSEVIPNFDAIEKQHIDRMKKC